MKVANTRLIYLPIAVGLLIFLHYVGVLVPLENLVRGLVKPLAVQFYGFSRNFKTQTREIDNRQDLVTAAKELEAKITELTVENARLKSVEEENLALREALDFRQSAGRPMVLANAITRRDALSPLDEDQVLILDKGSSHGLIAGLPVVSSQGVMIGKVAGVKGNVAFVSVTTSPKCKLAAAVLGGQKTIGLAEGNFNLTIAMNYIPQTEEIKPGDTVVTSGLEENIPPGLVIGQVVEVAKANNEVWQKAIIEPLADYEELTVVSVILALPSQ